MDGSFANKLMDHFFRDLIRCAIGVFALGLVSGIGVGALVYFLWT